MIGSDTWLRGRIRDVVDFPTPGVVFRDITPLLGDHAALEHCIESLVAPFEQRGISKVVGIEARGFILAPSVAMRLGAGFVPVRKVGKLPFGVVSETYDLEYGTDTLEIHNDALVAGERVLIVDDVLATGGTASAGVRLVEALGAEVVAFACVIEIGFLSGRGKLGDLEVVSLINYDCE